MSESRVSPGARRRVAARAGHRCEYCCSPEAFSAAPFCVEDIIRRLLIREGEHPPGARPLV